MLLGRGKLAGIVLALVLFSNVFTGLGQLGNDNFLNFSLLPKVAFADEGEEGESAASFERREGLPHTGASHFTPPAAVGIKNGIANPNTVALLGTPIITGSPVSIGVLPSPLAGPPIVPPPFQGFPTNGDSHVVLGTGFWEDIDGFDDQPNLPGTFLSSRVCQARANHPPPICAEFSDAALGTDLADHPLLPGVDTYANDVISLNIPVNVPVDCSAGCLLTFQWRLGTEEAGGEFVLFPDFFTAVIQQEGVNFALTPTGLGPRSVIWYLS